MRCIPETRNGAARFDVDSSRGEEEEEGGEEEEGTLNFELRVNENPEAPEVNLELPEVVGRPIVGADR